MACTYVWHIVDSIILLQIDDIIDSTQQTAPTEPVMESYAVTEILSVKDKKKDKKVCIGMYICMCIYIVYTYVRSYNLMNS